MPRKPTARGYVEPDLPLHRHPDALLSADRGDPHRLQR